MVEGQNLCFKALRCAFRPTTFKQMQLFSALSGTWWISLWTSPDVRFLGRHNGVIYVPARAGAHWNLRPNVVPTKTDPLVCGVTTSLSKGTPPTYLSAPLHVTGSPPVKRSIWRYSREKSTWGKGNKTPGQRTWLESHRQGFSSPGTDFDTWDTVGSPWRRVRVTFQKLWQQEWAPTGQWQSRLAPLKSILDFRCNSSEKGGWHRGQSPCSSSKHLSEN